LLDDRRIRIQEAQKHTDPDPQEHCKVDHIFRKIYLKLISGKGHCTVFNLSLRGKTKKIIVSNEIKAKKCFPKEKIMFHR
jgi:hypothetical protein